ncbi:hypothetical protein [Nocardioides jiangxiensis]|uniref:Uncharacterized protein n=1 Tax=Nocardioides jiangxiensis TaxID=3064524 RepID=A0ABT9B5G8_9ACTN|nr:hypothetical protein [Nocardioides sp. WY-20]MDO7869549.1 hypothetical protein [Nocardioides sp. WY-20]
MTKTFAAIAMAMALVTMTATGAEAASGYMTDRTYDTTTAKGSPSSNQKAAADLTRVDYWHTSDGKVAFRYKVRDLRSDYRMTGFTWNANQTPRVWVNNTPGNTYTRVSVNGYVKCEATTVRDYSANTATVKFARSCFPKGVRYTPYVKAEYYSSNVEQRVTDNAGPGTSIVLNP